jgi:hypothetical protein
LTVIGYDVFSLRAKTGVMICYAYPSFGINKMYLPNAPQVENTKSARRYVEFICRPSGPVCEILLVLLYVSLFAAIAVACWQPSHFMRLTDDYVGELFEAYHGAINLLQFGWQWAGLEDQATSSGLASHPYLYIHHINGGLYFSYLLSLLGVKSIEAQNFISGFATVAGIVAGYWLIRKLTGSMWFGMIFLMLACTNFFMAEKLAFNIHRADSYLAVFLCLLTFHHIITGRITKKNILAFGLTVALAITTDYMFYLFLAMALPVYALLNAASTACYRPLVKQMALLFSIFGLMFCLRQAQVAIAIGPDVWLHDFFYQLLNRLHLEQLYRGDWSKDTTDFYMQHHILNPGFAPYVGWAQRYWEFFVAVGSAFMWYVVSYRVNTAPGPLPVDAFAPATCFAIGVTMVLVVALLAFMSVIAGYARRAKIPPVDRSKLAFEMLSVSLLCGCFMMYAVFPRYFMQWFPAFQLAMLCVTVWATYIFCTAFQWLGLSGRQWHAVGACIVVIKLIGVFPSISANWGRDFGDHADILRSLEGRVVMSNFTPATAASYTRELSGWIKPDAAVNLLNGDRLDKDAYAVLLERDMSNPKIYCPDYYIFFKYLGSAAELDALKAAHTPLREGNSYALFKVPEFCKEAL